MHRTFVPALALTTLLVAAGACSSDSGSTPITPTATPITEPTFTGTLNLNALAVYPFLTTAAGSVTATIADLDPDPNGNLVVGLSLGVWNGTSCQLQIVNPAASAGTSIIGAASGAGALCAIINDQGHLTEPVTFSINIVHF